MNFCIHGHFYQPPREDAISDFIPDEIGAEPYANWNERILAECYEPNAKAGNFGRISFNIGPTLFKWMATSRPDVVGMIVDQERANYEKFGTGNAIAQAYNHSILPLQNKMDKITQVRWGIKDFEFRFGHSPEGMWLPETAVDMETLTVLSDLGIRFTFLAPWQVHTDHESSGPFLIALPGGRPPFIVFTYDQDASTKVSFIPKATTNGDEFLYDFVRVRSGRHVPFVSIASDGELYGHHQPFRDYFLTYVLTEGASRFQLNPTWPGRWLQENSVKEWGKIIENTSWSCLHGVERWKTNCGCTPTAYWKAPLRHALDEIAEWIDRAYEDVLIGYMEDPWELRHRYVDVILGQISIEKLIKQFCGCVLSEEENQRIAWLLRAQYERQRMYTSCGFFFDEFHRIEPQNNIAYAANAVWLTQKAVGFDFSPAYSELLSKVGSQKTGLRGDTVFAQTLIRAKAETS